MTTSRFEFALKNLRASDWERFEKLASSFLAAEYDDLRSTASPSGDGGRDSELFSPTAEPRVVLQYSVALDWQSKINKTIFRLQQTLPMVQVLVYATNQAIGVDADAIRKRVRQETGLTLDIRDRHWFIDRVNSSVTTERSAEELSTAIVDPLLPTLLATPRAPQELSSPETSAAVTLLGLQWRDDARDKGLTKVAFEALVRSVLLRTDSEHRMSRSDVLDGVMRLLPGHPPLVVHQYSNAALLRLTKRALRHWTKEDEFCLTHDEKQRVDEQQVLAALAEGELTDAITRLSVAILAANDAPLDNAAEFVTLVKRAVGEILLERSQWFARAIHSSTMASLQENEFTPALNRAVAASSLQMSPGHSWVDLGRVAVREVLLSDDPVISAYLRSLSDSYTLFAFLRQTPDVQGAVSKMFSHGEIWLDTTVILPLLAELLSEDHPGRFTRMIGAAREAGIRLFVTPGVVEEIERHMNRALTCARMSYSQWDGAVPYLLDRFAASGRALREFGSWLETFRGPSRPEEDIADFLSDEFSITTRSLEKERNEAPTALRYALQAIWHEAHELRRSKQAVPIDPITMTRLVEHDVECYCGVIQLRAMERGSPFGYSAWWLTVDRQAFDLQPRLQAAMNVKPPDSPVLSADFLVNYLAFGPLRQRVSKGLEAQLPLIMGLGGARYLTPELLAEADRLREELRTAPDRVVRRRVRDLLDQARCKLGPVAYAGTEEFTV